MSCFLFVLGQVALSLPWGDLRTQTFWTLHGAELRKSSAYNSPYAYTLLLNGADKMGRPYQSENPRLSGWGDSAVCGCIRMDSIGPAYVIFAYQAGGKMDPPETDDTLTLWAMDRAGQWHPLWQAVGRGIPDSSFTTVSVLIDSSVWFHSCFRLKWTVWGSTYGAYDNWHVAYTVISRDTFYRRIAWATLPRTYDLRYGVWDWRYVPSDSVSAFIVGGGFRTEVEVEVRVGGRVLERRRQRVDSGEAEVKVRIPSLPGPGAYPVEWLLREEGDSLLLVDTLHLSEGRWGYDDGEMEGGYGLRQPNRGFCQVFTIDTVQRLARVGVRFFAIPTQYGKPFQLTIWDMERGMTPIYQKYERIFMDSAATWQWFEIDTPLVLRGDVGIGFVQADGQPLGIGWDASCPHGDRVQVESAGGWAPSRLEGCLMVQIETASPLTALAHADRWERRAYLRYRFGEAIILPSQLSAPVAIWGLDGRLIAIWQEGSVLLLPVGLYACIDQGGRVWHLHIEP